jgi:hypothetical protein
VQGALLVGAGGGHGSVRVVQLDALAPPPVDRDQVVEDAQEEEVGEALTETGR